MLTGKSITVGIAGGIATYKVAEVVSALVKKGAAVRVIMTSSAQEFIRPLTFSALTGHEVFTDMFNSRSGGVTHIELAQKSDLLVVAPATANIIGKAANGIADDLLSTVIIAANCPVMMCPTMNTVMYQNPVVQHNISKLQQLGYQFIGPNSGTLACGAVGPGRISEPDEILAAIEKNFLSETTCSTHGKNNICHSQGDLKGLNILVSAGPTREPIDPVRYITNRSSGKMGYNIARAAAERGARVVLVSGPVNLAVPPEVRLVSVETAQQMRNAMLKHFNNADVVIKSAAVADYRPKTMATEKIKKKNQDLEIKLEKNPDILAELGQLKQHQILVGFAAETSNLEAYAKEKLRAKNLDLLVANNVSTPGAGFDVDTNVVTIYPRQGDKVQLPLMEKYQVAHYILDLVVSARQVGDA